MCASKTLQHVGVFYNSSCEEGQFGVGYSNIRLNLLATGGSVGAPYSCISTTTDTSTSASIGSIMEGSSVAIDGPEFTTHPSPERRNPRPASFEEDTIIPRRFGLSPSRTSSATVFPVFPGPAHSPPSNGASASGGYESGPDGVRELSYLNGKGRHTLHGSLIGHAPNPNQRRRTFNLGSSSTETVEPVVLRKKRKKERHW